PMKHQFSLDHRNPKGRNQLLQFLQQTLRMRFIGGLRKRANQQRPLRHFRLLLDLKHPNQHSSVGRDFQRLSLSPASGQSRPSQGGTTTSSSASSNARQRNAGT